MKKLILGMLVVSGVFLSAAELIPEAPKGFLWKQLPFVKAQFLMPNDWVFNFDSQNKDERYIYYITKENIIQKGSYQTGMNIRVIRGVQAKLKGQKPSEYSESAVAETSQKVKFVKKWDQQKGIFKELGFMYVDNSEPTNSITVYRTYLSNDNSGTVYILTFEGPTKDWDMLWKTIGEVIFKNFSLDEAI